MVDGAESYRFHRHLGELAPDIIFEIRKFRFFYKSAPSFQLFDQAKHPGIVMDWLMGLSRNTEANHTPLMLV